MEIITSKLFIYYTFYGFFTFYLKKWSTEFYGSSSIFYAFLGFYAGVTFFFGLYLLGMVWYFYGWSYLWKFFLLSFLGSIILNFVETQITFGFLRMDYNFTTFIMGIISCIIIPFLAVKLYWLVPYPF